MDGENDHHLPKEVDDAAINRALNLIAEYVGDRLPDGWTIQLTMSSDEAFVELTDPWDEEVEVYTDKCTIREMVEKAIEQA